MKRWQGALIMLGSAAVVSTMGIVGLRAITDCHFITTTTRTTWSSMTIRSSGRFEPKRVLVYIETNRVLVCGDLEPGTIELHSGAQIDGGP